MTSLPLQLLVGEGKCVGERREGEKGGRGRRGARGGGEGGEDNNNSKGKLARYSVIVANFST